MKIHFVQPIQRSKTINSQYTLEELKFIKLTIDLKRHITNLLYIVPRMIGNIGQFSEIPPSLQIEPTNYCNARYICCPPSRSTRKKEFMNFELFRNILEKALNTDIRRVRIFLYGKPLLRPRIVDMLTYLKERDLAYLITKR